MSKIIDYTNPKLSEQQLLKGSKDKDMFIRADVMSNTSATEKVLLIGSRDPDSWVRETTMKNDNATAKVLEIGSEDDSIRIVGHQLL